jgi:hypothetical protein
MLECKTVSIHVRNVLFIGFILFYLYQFVALFTQYLKTRDPSLRSAVYFWFFGFITVTVTQLILLNAREFEQSPLKTFCWSLSSGLDHFPFMFMMNYLLNSFEIYNIFPALELKIIRIISYLIMFGGLIPPIVYISVPEDSSYDSTAKFIPHFVTCIITALADTFFLYSMFRLFMSNPDVLKTYMSPKLLKSYQIGLTILALILFFRNALLVVGCIPTYAYRLYFFAKDPTQDELFTFDYCMVDFIVYVLPYVFLAFGVNLNISKSDGSDSDDFNDVKSKSFFTEDIKKHLD